MDFTPIIREEYKKVLPMFAARRDVIARLKAQFNRQLLEFVANECMGKVGKSADYMGINRNTFRKLCVEAGINISSIVDKHR